VQGESTKTLSDRSLQDFQEAEKLVLQGIDDAGDGLGWDKRSLAVAKTHIETAFLWIARAAAKRSE
jgi:hypothetical protein